MRVARTDSDARGAPEKAPCSGMSLAGAGKSAARFGGDE
jgi:hypothetical protein